MTFQARSVDDHRASLRVALAPSANGRQLVRFAEPGKEFFYFADTAWELPHRLSMAEAMRFLQNRADKGFNAVMIVLLAEHGGLDYPSRSGEWPFFPSADATPEKYLPDLSKPNPAYFAFIDALIPLASSLGITLVLVPTWGRYVNGGYYTAPILFDETNAYEYCRFLGERYPFHPWMLGGDSNRWWNPRFKEALEAGEDMASLRVTDFGAITEAMVRGVLDGEKAAVELLPASVKKEAEGYTSFIAYHPAQRESHAYRAELIIAWLPNTPDSTASAQFPQASWLCLDGIQSGHMDRAPKDTTAASASVGMWAGKSSYVPIRKMYNTPRPDGRPRPVVDLEPHYEATHYSFELDRPIWNARDIRLGAWQGVFAGACGYTYGCNSIWQMHNGASTTHPPIEPPTTAYTDWFLELDLPGAFYAATMRRLILALPTPSSRVPNQSIILSGTHEPADGSWAGDELISGMTGDGWLMVHLPYGGDVTVDLTSIDGAWRAWWVDPRSGGRTLLERGQGVDKSFRSPTEGEQDGDWLLLVEKDVWV
ncbi:hypothetical protein Q5752_007106 [Cryptotrichosporon argae]